ncbi:MAG: spore coat associated protein CotJA [Clostridia bacterium]|nr:spore coat associated protein CotJA [Clostridia bacterium]
MVNAAKYKVMPSKFKLATAYIPFQYMCKLYSPMEGLMKGTIFPELYKPYKKK